MESIFKITYFLTPYRIYDTVSKRQEMWNSLGGWDIGAHLTNEQRMGGRDRR